MQTWIALFRGLNIGGHNLLPMKELVVLLSELQFQNIKTYIQSGNVIFQTRKKNHTKLAVTISLEIRKRYGFAPQVLLLRVEELAHAVEANPFPEAVAKPETLNAIFLLAPPSNPDWRALQEIKAESERFALVNQVFYLHAPDGVGRSKLAARVEQKLGVAATGRNWRTVLALLNMAQDAT
jgi:uncharacterized protein (DUF1697 family)